MAIELYVTIICLILYITTNVILNAMVMFACMWLSLFNITIINIYNVDNRGYLFVLAIYDIIRGDYGSK